MGKGSCLLSLADVCIWIAIVTSIAALFAPFWYSDGSPPTLSTGLFMTCTDPYHKFGQTSTCTFGKIDIDKAPIWWVASQGLWAGGTALMFLIGICSFVLCCERCRKASCSGLIFIGTLIAALALCSAVIVFGIKANDVRNIEMKRKGLYFDWGFYLAIVSSGTSLIAALLFGFVICCVRKE